MNSPQEARHLTVQLPEAGNKFYLSYNTKEDAERSAYHYEQAPEFYYIQTGGEWHVYSCLLWEEGFTLTQAQERKLDKLAEMMGLQPGMHILDVGCGWGGPLVYLCQRYGVSGRGISVSPKQVKAACERAAKYGVDAEFELIHWQNLPDVAMYDAIYSDEVIVHFNDLGGFFAKCYQLLKPGCLMAHKELHLTHQRHGELGPLSEHVNQIFNFTGNYVTLHHELQLLEENGFQLKSVYEIPLKPHYHKTVDTWLKNTFEAREDLKDIAGKDFYKNFRAYLKAVRFVFTRTENMLLHIVSSRKLTDEGW